MPRKKESFCSFTNQKMTFFWKLKMTFFPSLLDSPVLCFSCMDVQATIFFKMNNKMQNRNTASQRCSWKLEWDNFIKLLRYKGLDPWNAGWSLSTVAVIWMFVKRVFAFVRAWHGRTFQIKFIPFFDKENIIHLDNFGRHTMYVHQVAIFNSICTWKGVVIASNTLHTVGALTSALHQGAFHTLHNCTSHWGLLRGV